MSTAVLVALTIALVLAAAYVGMLLLRRSRPQPPSEAEPEGPQTVADLVRIRTAPEDLSGTDLFTPTAPKKGAATAVPPTDESAADDDEAGRTVEVAVPQPPAPPQSTPAEGIEVGDAPWRRAARMMGSEPGGAWDTAPIPVVPAEGERANGATRAPRPHASTGDDAGRTGVVALATLTAPAAVKSGGAEQAPGERIAVEQVPAERTAVEQIAVERVPAEQTAAGQAPVALPVPEQALVVPPAPEQADLAPAAVEPAAVEPVGVEPAGVEPAVVGSVVDGPAAQQPVVEEPVVEEPVVEESAAEKSVTVEPAGERVPVAAVELTAVESTVDERAAEPAPIDAPSRPLSDPDLTPLMGIPIVRPHSVDTEAPLVSVAAAPPAPADEPVASDAPTPTDPEVAPAAADFPVAEDPDPVSVPARSPRFSDPRDDDEVVAMLPVPSTSPLPLVATGSPQPVWFRVVDRDGEPVASAVVALLDPHGQEVDTTKTATDGGGELRTPHGGRFLMIASADGFQPRAVILNVEEQPVEIALLLPRSAALSGAVRAAGEAVGGARVVARQEGEVVDEMTTGADGGYRFGDLAEGVYALAATAARGSAVRRVTVAAGADLQLDLDLVRPDHAS